MSDDSFSDRNPRPMKPEGSRGEGSAQGGADKKRKFREFGPAGGNAGATGGQRPSGQAPGPGGTTGAQRQQPRFSGQQPGQARSGNGGAASEAGSPAAGASGSDRNHGRRRGGDRKPGTAPAGGPPQSTRSQSTNPHSQPGGNPPAGQVRDSAQGVARPERQLHSDRNPQQQQQGTPRQPIQRPAGQQPATAGQPAAAGQFSTAQQKPAIAPAPQPPAQAKRSASAQQQPAGNPARPAEAPATRSQQAPAAAQQVRPTRERVWDTSRIKAEETYEDIHRENERLEKEIWMEIASIHTLTLD